MPNEKSSDSPVKALSCSLCDEPIYTYNAIRKRYEALPICKRYYITFDNGQIMPIGICKDCLDGITDKKIEKIIKRSCKFFYNDIQKKGIDPEDNKFYKNLKKLKLGKHSLLKKQAHTDRKEILDLKKQEEKNTRIENNINIVTEHISELEGKINDENTSENDIKEYNRIYKIKEAELEELKSNQ